ncbi:hypothetical protein F5Y05DRAFT_118874 [Hypoxylon sp. FL0543]|nr:hypothetical protein F5Y05DRAFT_118874 [Hypoxylon sp. FL0543]
MNCSQISLLQREVYGDHRERAFRPPRRTQSLPPLKAQSWAPEYSSVKQPRRSLSLQVEVKGQPLVIPQCVAARGELQLGIEIEGEEYDSDEEDRRNGVPITVTENRGCELTSDMKEYVSRKIDEKLEEKRQLQEQLAISSQMYLTSREWLFESHGVDWDARTWLGFIALEDEYYEKTDEIYTLDCEIGHLETILANFTGVGQLPRGSWNVRTNGHRAWYSPDADYGRELEMLELEDE